MVEVEEVTKVDDELVAAFERLVPQLSSSNPPPTERELAAIVTSRSTVLFVARDRGEIVELATEVDAGFVLTLGALLAEVPHTRPTSVMATSEDARLSSTFGLSQSSYEGPTGIVGVLHDACARAGLASMSVWAAVPAYVPAAPSPKGALALVRRVAELLDAPIAPTDLEIAAASYERQVSEVVADDDEMADYLARLEERYDDGDGVPSPASLVEEVERFLRDQRNN